MDLDDLRRTGFSGVVCVESGGPEPGVGCAGRGVVSPPINLLEQLGAYADSEMLDYAFYDVLGDVVCGGFAMPIREERKAEIYIVVSGEMIAVLLKQQHSEGYRQVRRGRGRAPGGRHLQQPANVDNEREMIEAFADKLGTQMVHFIPRDNMVQKAEINRKTVVELDNEHSQADEYRTLAGEIEANEMHVIPKPMSTTNWKSCSSITAWRVERQGRAP